MVDIVYRSISDVNLNEILHRVYNIIKDKRTFFNRVLVIKFFIQLVPAHTAEIIPAGGETHRS